MRLLAVIKGSSRETLVWLYTEAGSFASLGVTPCGRCSPLRRGSTSALESSDNVATFGITKGGAAAADKVTTVSEGADVEADVVA